MMVGRPDFLLPLPSSLLFKPFGTTTGSIPLSIVAVGEAAAVVDTGIAARLCSLLFVGRRLLTGEEETLEEAKDLSTKVEWGLRGRDGIDDVTSGAGVGSGGSCR